ncbi:MAG: hypothetical protein RBT43_05335 [bacterium]|jgi:selenophosphate synthetase-related protein|nr:hypothetical protein [bacterium]
MEITTETIYRSFLNKEHKLFVRSLRDLTLIRISDRHSLVIAVDSDGGIGPQEGDVVKVSAYISGRFAIRVPLLEILASGATPLCAFDMLTTPMNAIGKEILRGVREELEAAGFAEDFVVSGSTEDNVPTNMTGIGTTIIGMIENDRLRIGSTQKTDILICVGKPKSGPHDEVRLEDPEILSQESMKILLRIDGIHDILPVGSHGIAYEAQLMAQSAGLLADISKNEPIDTGKSAGPSTCVLASCNEEAYHRLQNCIWTPVYRLGKFKD